MARSAAVAVENSFIRGLITEATGLNFPENACTDTDNCIFERIGNVTRRSGIDLEPGFVTQVEELSGSAITEFLWKAAALNGEIVFLVVQVGVNILFYRLDDSTTLSANLQSFSYDLTTNKVPGSPDVGSLTCSFASGNGVLFITHPYCEPVFITYDPVANTISSTAITIKIRDMRGLDQSAMIEHYNDRPTFAQITDTIKYNLLNQGWVTSTKFDNGQDGELFNLEQATDNSGIGITPVGQFAFGPEPAIDAWFDPTVGSLSSNLFDNGTPNFGNPHTTVYPSEAETWWFYLYPGAVRPFFDTSRGAEIFPLNAPAAKGHFIYPAFNINRVSVSQAEYLANGGNGSNMPTSLPVESSGYYRPSQVGFYAGRAFYAGVPATGYSTKIYFTRVTEQPVDYGRCHQLLDPTSQDGGDLVASDGGVIVIPDIAQVIKLFTTGANLFVFATNGIWRVSGGLGNTGFAADNYTISRISIINAQSSLSFVDVDGVPVWWNNDGIWTLKSDQLGTSVQVESLTLQTISTFIEDEISATNKRFVKGAFNPFSRIVQWIYRSTEPESIEEQYQYDRLLNYDALTKAFYPWSLTDDSSSRIAGIFVPQGTVSKDTIVVVTTSTGATVQTSGGDDVVVNRPQPTSLESVFKYIVLTPSVAA